MNLDVARFLKTLRFPDLRFFFLRRTTETRLRLSYLFFLLFFFLLYAFISSFRVTHTQENQSPSSPKDELLIRTASVLSNHLAGNVTKSTNNLSYLFFSLSFSFPSFFLSSPIPLHLLLRLWLRTRLSWHYQGGKKGALREMQEGLWAREEGEERPGNDHAHRSQPGVGQELHAATWWRDTQRDIG